MNPSNNGNTQAVLFDLDGVILDSMAGHAAAWRETFSEVGVDIPLGVFLEHEGNLEWESLRRVFAPQRSDLGPGTFDALIDRQRNIYIERYAAEAALYPDVSDLITALRRSGKKLAIVTSSARRILPAWLLDFLEGGFDLVVTREMVTKGKPSPEPYLAALHGLGVRPDCAVVVENAPAGIEAARAAGVFCVALTTTLNADRLGMADRVFRDHDELARWLEQGNGDQTAP